MYITLSTGQAADRLVADENACWTYSGAKALVEFLEEEETADAQIELDVEALRSEWTEYHSAVEAAQLYGFVADDDDDEDTQEELAAEYLLRHTIIIKFDEGVIVQEA